jgi:hypothetical protein
MIVGFCCLGFDRLSHRGGGGFDRLSHRGGCCDWLSHRSDRLSHRIAGRFPRRKTCRRCSHPNCRDVARYVSTQRGGRTRRCAPTNSSENAVGANNYSPFPAYAPSTCCHRCYRRGALRGKVSHRGESLPTHIGRLSGILETLPTGGGRLSGILETLPTGGGGLSGTPIACRRERAGDFDAKRGRDLMRVKISRAGWSLLRER